MRRPRKQQDRCQMLYRGKSNNTHGNSHGFELSRTVSCRLHYGKKATKRHKRHIKQLLCLFVANSSGGSSG